MTEIRKQSQIPRSTVRNKKPKTHQPSIRNIQAFSAINSHQMENSSNGSSSSNTLATATTTTTATTTSKNVDDFGHHQSITKEPRLSQQDDKIKLKASSLSSPINSSTVAQNTTLVSSQLPKSSSALLDNTTLPSKRDFKNPPPQPTSSSSSDVPDAGSLTTAAYKYSSSCLHPPTFYLLTPPATETDSMFAFSNSVDNDYSVNTVSQPLEQKKQLQTSMQNNNSNNNNNNSNSPLPIPIPINSDEESVVNPKKDNLNNNNNKAGSKYNNTSSPCSATSTDHLATPEWASPDLSCKSYLTQISLNLQQSDKKEDNNNGIRDPSKQNEGRLWPKRSLSLSLMGKNDISSQENSNLDGGEKSINPNTTGSASLSRLESTLDNSQQQTTTTKNKQADEEDEDEAEEEEYYCSECGEYTLFRTISNTESSSFENKKLYKKQHLMNNNSSSHNHHHHQPNLSQCLKCHSISRSRRNSRSAIGEYLKNQQNQYNSCSISSTSSLQTHMSAYLSGDNNKLTGGTLLNMESYTSFPSIDDDEEEEQQQQQTNEIINETSSNTDKTEEKKKKKMNFLFLPRLTA